DLGKFAHTVGGTVSATIGVLNAVTGPSDLLTGSFGTFSGDVAAFTNGGFGGIGPLGASSANNGNTIVFSEANDGIFTQTVTFTGTGSNSSGYSAALTPITLVVTGTVVEGAQAQVAPTSTAYGVIRLGSTTDEAVTISNLSSPGSSFLDAT